MKKTEQKKLTSMNQKIVFFCIWVIILVLFIMAYIVPKLYAINTLRNELNEDIAEYEKYKHTGLSREELQADQEIKRILDSDEGKIFFQNYYTKPSDDERDYLTFLQDRYEDIKNNQGREELKAREKELSRVIPYFDQ